MGSVPLLYQGSKYAPGPIVAIPPEPGAAPSFLSAEIGAVNASTVAVLFDQDVSASNYATGVTIKVNGTDASITSATRQSNHAVVYYALLDAVIVGDAVTWEYAKALGSIIAESGGAALEDVSAQSVKNNLIVALPPVASATLLRDWRSSDFLGLPDGTALPDPWTSHDAQAHALNHGAGSSHLIVSKAGTTNTRKYVEFNGLNDYLIDRDSADLDNLNSFSVFMAGDWTPIIAKMTRSSDGGGWALYSQSTTVLIQEEGGSNWIEKDCDNPTTFTGITTMEVISKSEIHIYQDNNNSTEVDNGNPPIANYSTSQKLQIGAWGDLHLFSGGWLFGILIYSPAPSAADRAAIVQWMIDNELGTET